MDDRTPYNLGIDLNAQVQMILRLQQQQHLCSPHSHRRVDSCIAHSRSGLTYFARFRVDTTLKVATKI